MDKNKIAFKKIWIDLDTYYDLAVLAHTFDISIADTICALTLLYNIESFFREYLMKNNVSTLSKDKSIKKNKSHGGF